MTTVTIRAFTAQGYQRDIAVVDERQVRMKLTGINVGASFVDGLAGPCVKIDPKEFPEVVLFEVIVTGDR